jgi:hypothetical protein
VTWKSTRAPLRRAASSSRRRDCCYDGRLGLEARRARNLDCRSSCLSARSAALFRLVVRLWGAHLRPAITCDRARRRPQWSRVPRQLQTSDLFRGAHRRTLLRPDTFGDCHGRRRAEPAGHRRQPLEVHALSKALVLRVDPVEARELEAMLASPGSSPLRTTPEGERPEGQGPT